MSKITVTLENLQALSAEFENFKPEDPILLSQQSLRIIRASLESLCFLYQLLQGGGGIKAVRELFGIKLQKQGGQPDHDDPPPPNDSPSPTEPSDSSSQGDATDHEPQEETDSNESENPSDEPDCAPPTDDSDENQGSTCNGNHPGRPAASDFPNASICSHKHATLKVGDRCPDCLKGKLVLAKPREQLFFVGSAPITPTRHRFLDLICSLCSKVFKAEPDEKQKEDGLGEERLYGYSAIAMIAILKYFSDLPLYRSAKLHNLHGINLPPSSQFDQAEKLANTIFPLFNYSRVLMGSFSCYFADDATALVLDTLSRVKSHRSTGKASYRDGCHSSVVIGLDDWGRPLVQIKTDIIHSGEFMDEILRHRCSQLAAPIVMWDRCSVNRVTVGPILDAACNQHARQKFKDCQNDHPSLTNLILDCYWRIFSNDSKTHQMTDQQRLDYHQTKSKPHFDRILTLARNALNSKAVTPNSEVGKACQYVLTHESALGAFFKYEGAPVSNNLAERTIVYIVLLRKNCHFFKTLTGARVADVILSVGLSAYYYGVNLFEYFRLMMANSSSVRKEPEAWLPWTFLERYPEYEIKHKTRRGSWPPLTDAIGVPLAPPR